MIKLLIVIVVIIILIFLFFFREILINSNLQLINKIKFIDYIDLNIKPVILKNENDFIESPVKHVPKNLIQVYHLPDKIPDYIKQNKNKYASDYKYYFFDDNTGLTFIKQYFTDLVVDKYTNLTGSHKADLLRYCLLYVYGGIYADIKIIFVEPLNEIFDHSLMSSKNIFYSVKSVMPNTLFQGILGSNKYNPIFLALIYLILNTSQFLISLDYLIITRQIYKLIEKLKDEEYIVLFKESCITNATLKKDRYGKYCKIVEEKTNKHLFDTRDPKYPW
jgi:hypothetical protein